MHTPHDIQEFIGPIFGLSTALVTIFIFIFIFCYLNFHDFDNEHKQYYNKREIILNGRQLLAETVVTTNSAEVKIMKIRATILEVSFLTVGCIIYVFHVKLSF